MKRVIRLLITDSADFPDVDVTFPLPDPDGSTRRHGRFVPDPARASAVWQWWVSVESMDEDEEHGPEWEAGYIAGRKAMAQRVIQELRLDDK